MKPKNDKKISKNNTRKNFNDNKLKNNDDFKNKAKIKNNQILEKWLMCVILLTNVVLEKFQNFLSIKIKTILILLSENKHIYNEKNKHCYNWFRKYRKLFI